MRALAVLTVPAAALAIALALAGCGKPESERKLDRLDAQLLANQTDPALTGSLADQIVIDPARTGSRAPAATKRPAPVAKPAPAKIAVTAPTRVAPASRFARVPPPIAPAAPVAGHATPGDLAQAQARPGAPAPAPPPARPADVGAVSGRCYADLAYGAGWAAKLPAVLPVYPGARLQEAAGNETHGCAVRIVSFTAHAPWRTIADWYRARAARAGWDADEAVRGDAHVVAGTAADGSAFYLTLAPEGAGTAADMIVSLGH